MDAGGELVVRRELAEQAGQLCAVVLLEGGEQVLAVCPRDLPDLQEALLTDGGDVESVVAPVGGTAAALEQPVELKLVDERDELAGQQPELEGEGLLRAPRGGGHSPEQTGMRGVELQRAEALSEAQGGQAADLGEQESDVSGALLASISCCHEDNASSPE